MIRPNIGMLTTKNGKDMPFNDQARMEPLQLGVLAGITPSDIDVKLFDDRLEEINYDDLRSSIIDELIKSLQLKEVMK